MGCGSSAQPVAKNPENAHEDADQDGAMDPNEAPILFSRRPAGRQPGEVNQNAARTAHQGTRWNLGSIHMPAKYEGQTFPLDPPAENLELDYVFGYRGRDTRDSVHFLNANEIVYCMAATGIVFDRAANRQRFYRGHSDDIWSIAVNPSKTIVATGQCGKDKGPQGAPPTIQLWDPRTCQKIGELRGHTNGISVLSFSPDGRFLVSCGVDDDCTMCVHEVASCRLINKQSTGRNKILACKFNPAVPTQFALTGVKVIKFGSIEGADVKLEKGILADKGEYQTFPAVEFFPDGRCAVGTAKGEVYIFREKNLVKPKPIGVEPVNAMLALPDGILAASGNTIVRLTNDSQCTQNAKMTAPLVDASSSIRSLAMLGNELLIGTSKNELVSVQLDANMQMGNPRTVMASHFDEVWGLKMHPTQPNIALTACDDATVRMWDFVANRPLDKFPVPGGKDKARVLDISPDGRWLVVGTETGKAYVIDNTNPQARPNQICNRTRQISEIKFSPDGRKLILGNHESEIDVYTVPDFQKVGTLKGNSSYISHADWSADSAFLRTTAGSGELLFWDLNTCTQVTASSQLKDTEWATNHCIFGWPVQGIWPEASDITDINAVDLNPAGNLLVMGDDFRMVQMARFPCVDKASEKKHFNGHSEHVTNVRWSADGQSVVSVGGLDAGVFVWRLR